ncbi:OmpW/AlkL family protein [Janthinobacterium fluminis]|uniref:Outer membrane beta-barrel protein n=1 Tax=Janthinobacterium fluminis TaxID=2987524 RepID=A0ABT5K3R5_9BURK|nr:OmpW family outer membrane protein [Janthinobacterium fluminis]MDC8759633.1 outer membrane beta-barrel protein [Janthinobacterium fluminis]
MKFSLNSAAQLLALAAAMAAAPGASAQSAGQWTLKAGVNKITPKVTSGDVSAPALPHSKGAVSSDTQPVLIVAYGLSDNISAEVDLGLPYKHTISGAGAIEGTGKLGTVEALPPTAFIQYRFFTPAAKVRPYVGLGATYAYFQKATGSAQMTAITNIGGQATTFKIDNKLAATLQAGIVLALNERWYADLAVTKTFLKTKVRFSTGQTQDMTLDPLAVSFGIGYKF